MAERTRKHESEIRQTMVMENDTPKDSSRSSFFECCSWQGKGVSPAMLGHSSSLWLPLADQQVRGEATAGQVGPNGSETHRELAT